MHRNDEVILGFPRNMAGGSAQLHFRRSHRGELKVAELLIVDKAGKTIRPRSRALKVYEDIANQVLPIGERVIRRDMLG